MSATKSNPAKPVGLFFFYATIYACAKVWHKRKTYIRSIARLLFVVRHPTECMGVRCYATTDPTVYKWVGIIMLLCSFY